MAKSTKKDAKSSASKPEKKAQKPTHNDNQEKVEAAEPAPTAALEPQAPALNTRKSEFTATLTEQFAAVRDTIKQISSAAKQPRKVRWALKTLAMAEEAAARAVLYSD